MANAAEERANDAWSMVQVPKGVRLSGVAKERGTHGSIYCVWEVECKCPCWVSQSIPATVSAINTKAIFSQEKRLHASSIYRVLRGESHKMLHKSHTVKRWSRSAEDLQHLNDHLARFPSCIFITKVPEIWKVNSSASTPSAPSEPRACQGVPEVRAEDCSAEGAGPVECPC